MYITVCMYDTVRCGRMGVNAQPIRSDDLFTFNLCVAIFSTLRKISLTEITLTFLQHAVL